MAVTDTHRAIEAVFRIERARLLASLVRMVRDVERAENLAQEALLTALTEWPRSGVPNNPGAWLTTAAKRRAIDSIRRETMQERKHGDDRSWRNAATSAIIILFERPAQLCATSIPNADMPCRWQSAERPCPVEGRAH